MAGYILRRLVSSIVVLWLVITVTFVLMHLAPGGPFSAERSLPPATERAIAARYHLDDPLWKQYLSYLANLLRGDLGPSMKTEGRRVNDIIADTFPVSARIGLLSILLSLAVGIPAGAISAVRRHRIEDHVAMTAAIGMVSVPSFVMTTLLILLFANPAMPWPAFLPPTFSSGGTPLPGETAALKDRILPLIIPSIALSTFSLAYIARLMRSSFLEVMNKDYIRTARAKGLSPAKVVFKHGLRNALSPVATYLGPMTASILTGSLVVERIYSIPGLGGYFVSSIDNRDYSVIMGVTLFYCAFLVFMNLLVDLIYPLLDPRIVYGRKK